MNWRTQHPDQWSDRQRKRMALEVDAAVTDQHWPEWADLHIKRIMQIKRIGLDAGWNRSEENLKWGAFEATCWVERTYADNGQGEIL